LSTYGFLRKNQIKNNEIVRYKVQSVAQGFSQNLILICEKTFSGIVCNNIAIFDYPSCATRFAFTSNE